MKADLALASDVISAGVGNRSKSAESLSSIENRPVAGRRNDPSDTAAGVSPRAAKPLGRQLRERGALAFRRRITSILIRQNSSSWKIAGIKPKMAACALKQ